MGHSNGQHDKPSTTGKVEKVKIGFKTTPDNHFDLQNKRITNISAPMDDHDAVTKRFVSDLLKAKAAWTMVQIRYIVEDNSSYCILINVGTLQNRYNMAFVQGFLYLLGVDIFQSYLNEFVLFPATVQVGVTPNSLLRSRD